MNLGLPSPRLSASFKHITFTLCSHTHNSLSLSHRHKPAHIHTHTHCIYVHIQSQMPEGCLNDTPSTIRLPQKPGVLQNSTYRILYYNRRQQTPSTLRPPETYSLYPRVLILSLCWTASGGIILPCDVLSFCILVSLMTVSYRHPSLVPDVLLSLCSRDDEGVRAHILPAKEWEPSIQEVSGAMVSLGVFAECVGIGPYV